MRTFILAVFVIAVLPALAGVPTDHYTGRSYEVEIFRGGDSNGLTACLTFGENGYLSVSRSAFPLVWTKQDDYPRRFVAVTTFSHRGIVPFDVGMHGKLEYDLTLGGSGIDQYGRTFEFRGKPNDGCRTTRLTEQSGSFASDSVTPKGQTSSADLLALVDATQPIGKDLVLDPCWAPAGSEVPCDPVVDPLRTDSEKRPASRLPGYGYRLTLLTDDAQVREYCWNFVDHRTLYRQDGGEMRWAADGYGDPATTFQSVTATGDKVSMAYHGKLYGNMLYVAGIEAVGEKKVAVWGYGQQIAACERF